mmetsp:Transcript_67224/g.115435  ORF Transcript_67224/g.115435 Transcript_67224/m.115435 type:complete len:418 (+) Transcript_67224:104-1357(+)
MRGPLLLCLVALISVRTTGFSPRVLSLKNIRNWRVSRKHQKEQRLLARERPNREPQSALIIGQRSLSTFTRLAPVAASVADTDVSEQDDIIDISDDVECSEQESKEVEASTTDSSEFSSIDKHELVKYVLATGLQFVLMASTLFCADKLSLSLLGRAPPPWCVGFLFAFLSLRSRVFSFLDSSRPKRKAQGGKATPSDVKRPDWTPPGVAFPIIWLTITVLRAVSARMVYVASAAESSRRLACGPLFGLMLHLCVGDTWNTITNVEQRLGVSAVACGAVALSVYSAVWGFWRTRPLAGLVLLPSAVWITVACKLTYDIWRLNDSGGTRTDGRQSLVPLLGDGRSSKWGVDFSVLGLVSRPMRKRLNRALNGSTNPVGEDDSGELSPEKRAETLEEPEAAAQAAATPESLPEAAAAAK